MLNEFFESVVEIPRIKVGKRQTIETLINGEAQSIETILEVKLIYGYQDRG